MMTFAPCELQTTNYKLQTINSSMKHILFLMMLFAGKQLYAQNPENWTQKDLIEPAELASVIQSGKKVPLIICVGPGAVIPNSIHVGMAKEEANLDKFKE